MPQKATDKCRQCKNGKGQCLQDRYKNRAGQLTDTSSPSATPKDGSATAPSIVYTKTSICQVEIALERPPKAVQHGKIKKRRCGLRAEGCDCPSWFKPSSVLILLYHKMSAVSSSICTNAKNAAREPSRGVAVSGSLAETTSAASVDSISDILKNVNRA